MKYWLTATTVAALVMQSLTAHAQVTEAEIAGRRVLLEQAQQARASNDFPRALDLAQRAGRIQMTPSLRLFLAEVQAAMGNHAGAVGSADLCIRETERDTAARNREQILSNCRTIMTSSRARVGYVTVTLGQGAPPHAAITIGGAALNEALLGVPYVVNSGAVVVHATAPGHQAFDQQVMIAPGATIPVEVTLAVNSATITVASTGSNTTANTTTTTTTTGTSTGTSTGTTTGTTAGTTVTGPTGPTGPAVVPPPNRGRVPIGAVVVLSVGAVSLGTSLVFYMLRNANLAGCTIEGDTVFCDNQASAMNVPAARTDAVISMATLGIGAAAIVGGGIWLGLGLASGGRAQTATARVSVVPTVLAIRQDSFSLGIAGRF